MKLIDTQICKSLTKSNDIILPSPDLMVYIKEYYVCTWNVYYNLVRFSYSSLVHIIVVECKLFYWQNLDWCS